MKRLRVFILKDVTVLTLLVCLSLTITSRIPAYGLSPHLLSFDFSRDGLSIDIYRRGPIELRASSFKYWTLPGVRAAHAGYWPTRTLTFDHYSAEVSWWLVLIPFQALAVAHFFAWRKRSHDIWLRAAGRCRTCGYDLRATPARCPECGAVPREEKK